jgi:rhodanese-related sulfurtransferase
LFTLPDETLVYPGHDYQQRWVSCIMQERTTNPRLAGKSREEFIEIMANLNLPRPRLIDEAVPANRYCGLDENERQDAVARRDGESVVRGGSSTQDLVAEAKQQITEIDVIKAKELLSQGNIRIIDVREESEFAAGHLENAIPLPRGVLEFKIGNIEELGDKSQTILVYCRTGGRAALSALSLKNLGYTQVLSIAGGFDAWQKG